MDRRSFVAAGLAAGVAAISSSRAEDKPAAKPSGPASPRSAEASKFKLKYAPGFGLFEESAGKDPIDQLKFFADEGFSAMFDNDLGKKPPELQELLARQCQQLGLAMGPFAAYAEFGRPTFVLKDNTVRESSADYRRQPHPQYGPCLGGNSRISHTLLCRAGLVPPIKLKG